MSQTEQSAPVRLGDTSTVVNPELGGATAGRAETWLGKPSNYYGIPLIHKAGWRWQIILYFFLGGIAGGSYLVATLAGLLNIGKKEELVRSGRYLSFACILISPVLLILTWGGLSVFCICCASSNCVPSCRSAPGVSARLGCSVD